MEGIHYFSIQAKSHSSDPNRSSPPLSPCSHRDLRWSNPTSCNPYLLAVTRCGQCITTLPTLEIQLGCDERERELSVGLQMADKNPIGHSVKGSNGGDVHTLSPVGESRAGAGKGKMKDTLGGGTCKSTCQLVVECKAEIHFA